MNPINDAFVVADEADQPIRYIERTRSWYAALGYENLYSYAHFRGAPFTRLAKPLSESRVTLLTTAAPFRPDKGDQSATAPYNAAAKFYEVYSATMAGEHDLRVSHVGINRARITDDSNCWFPLPALRRAVDVGRVGGLTEHFHGVPTNRSQRHTIAVDVPEVVARCQADGAEAAILVPNCPICHQSMGLMARGLEQAGIATVIMGAAKDIVEHCGVPRFVFSDFPLGNAAARPYDRPSQDSTLALALDLLERAPGPRTTLQNPLVWLGDGAWHATFMNVDKLKPAELAELRAKNDAIKNTARSVREKTLAT